MTKLNIHSMTTEHPITLAIIDKSIHKNQNDLCEFHMHSLTEICWCKQGTVVFDENYTGFILEHDTFVVIPPSYNHNIMSMDNGQEDIESVYLDVEGIAKFCLSNSILKQNHISSLIGNGLICLPVDHAPALYDILHSVRGEYEREDAFYFESAAAKCFILLIELYRLYREQKGLQEVRIPSMNSKLAEQISPAIRYIEAHYHEELKINKLSQKCHMSESHFRRLFEERTGMAPVDYINRQRINESCKLLTAHNLTMEEISVRCGFGNVSTFYRNFKKIMGDSPSKWAQIH